MHVFRTLRLQYGNSILLLKKLCEFNFFRLKISITSFLLLLSSSQAVPTVNDVYSLTPWETPLNCGLRVGHSQRTNDPCFSSLVSRTSFWFLTTHHLTP